MKRVLIAAVLFALAGGHAALGTGPSLQELMDRFLADQQAAAASGFAYRSQEERDRELARNKSELEQLRRDAHYSPQHRAAYEAQRIAYEAASRSPVNPSGGFGPWRGSDQARAAAAQQLARQFREGYERLRANRAALERDTRQRIASDNARLNDVRREGSARLDDAADRVLANFEAIEAEERRRSRSSTDSSSQRPGWEKDAAAVDAMQAALDDAFGELAGDEWERPAALSEPPPELDNGTLLELLEDPTSFEPLDPASLAPPESGAPELDLEPEWDWQEEYPEIVAADATGAVPGAADQSGSENPEGIIAGTEIGTWIDEHGRLLPENEGNSAALLEGTEIGTWIDELGRPLPAPEGDYESRINGSETGTSIDEHDVPPSVGFLVDTPSPPAIGGDLNGKTAGNEPPDVASSEFDSGGNGMGETSGGVEALDPELVGEYRQARLAVELAEGQSTSTVDALIQRSRDYAVGALDLDASSTSLKGFRRDGMMQSTVGQMATQVGVVGASIDGSMAVLEGTKAFRGVPWVYNRVVSPVAKSVGEGLAGNSGSAAFEAVKGGVGALGEITDAHLLKALPSGLDGAIDAYRGDDLGAMSNLVESMGEVTGSRVVTSVGITGNFVDAVRERHRQAEEMAFVQHATDALAEKWIWRSEENAARFRLRSRQTEHLSEIIVRGRDPELAQRLRELEAEHPALAAEWSAENKAAVERLREAARLEASRATTPAQETMRQYGIEPERSESP